MEETRQKTGIEATMRAEAAILVTLKEHAEKLRSIEGKVDTVLQLAIDYRLGEMKSQIADHEKRLRDSERFRWTLHGVTWAMSVAAGAILRLIWK